MRCTTVKVQGSAHLMYVILHNGRVVREWELAGGFQEGTERMACREAMPGSGINRVVWYRSPNNLDVPLDSGRSGQGRSVDDAEWCSCHMPYPWRLSIRRLFAGMGSVVRWGVVSPCGMGGDGTPCRRGTWRALRSRFAPSRLGGAGGAARAAGAAAGATLHQR